MPSPALAPPRGGGSITLPASDTVKFPRAVPSVPSRHRRGLAQPTAAAAAETFSSSGLSAVATRKQKKTTTGDGRDAAFDSSRVFRGCPVAPFSTPLAARDNARMAEGDGLAYVAALPSSLSGASLTGPGDAEPQPTDESVAQPLANLQCIPIGSLLLGVIAEIHSEDMLVHLPDGVIGWIPRAHAFPLSAEREETQREENGTSAAKRSRKGALGGQAVLLTAHYFVGQVVQCVVIAEGGDKSSSRGLPRERGHTLVLSLRPSLFNAGLQIEAIHAGMVLPAALSSVEDHGYAFSLEVGDFSAFLPSCELQITSSSHTATWSVQSHHSGAVPEIGSPLRILPHTIVSLRIDRVNAASKVVICSLPGSGKRQSQLPYHQDQLSPAKPYLALRDAIAWAAVKPGCVVEARVQQVYRQTDAGELSANARTSPRLSENKQLSTSLERKEDMVDRAPFNVNDVVGVSVVCLGGDIVGTLLQPHFAHPLLRLDNDSYSQEFAREVGISSRKQNGLFKKRIAEKEEDPGEERASSDARRCGGKKRRKTESGCSSNICLNTIGCDRGEEEYNLQKAATEEAAVDSACDTVSFNFVEAQYSACLSELTRVGARIFARVTGVLSSTTHHVYLTLLPHLMLWRPCALPCTVARVLPGQRLVGTAAHVVSVFPPASALSGTCFSSTKKRASDTSPPGVSDGHVRVLLQRVLGGAEQKQLPELQTNAKTLLAASMETVCKSATELHDAGENAAPIDEGLASGSHSLTGPELEGNVSVAKATSARFSSIQRRCSAWILIRLPRCVMAAADRSPSVMKSIRKSASKIRSDARMRGHKNSALADVARGDILWSADRTSGSESCFCRVLYFDRFAAEVVGGNAVRLLKPNLDLTPFDVTPGQLVTGTVLRWRLPVESKRTVYTKQENVHAVDAGVIVRLSPYLTAFVPVHQLVDTPTFSFPSNVVPGSSIKLRVLQRVCCQSCTLLDKESAFASFRRKSSRTFSVASLARASCSRPLNYVQSFRLPGEADVDDLASGSCAMGIGGGGGGRLLLTGKKTFIKDSHPLVSIVAPPAFRRSHHEQTCFLHAGFTAIGYVKEVHKRAADGFYCEKEEGAGEGKEDLFSITIGFYNGLTARLSKEELHRALVKGRAFKLGTVVKVRILGVDTKHCCLRVTLDLSSADARASIAAARRKQEKFGLCLHPGRIVEKQRLTLLAVTEEGVFVAVKEMRRRDATSPSSEQSGSITNKKVATEEVAKTIDVSQGGDPEQFVVGIGFIPKMHLSDGVRVAEEMYSALQAGNTFPLDAVVLSAAVAVRTGALVQIWEPSEASTEENEVCLRKRRNQRSNKADSETGLNGALSRLKQALQEHTDAESDEKQEAHFQETLMKDVIILSCKPTLRVGARNGFFLKDGKALEKLRPTCRPSPAVLWGYVRKIGPYGLLVSFGAWQLTGLVPYSNISDTFIEDESHLRRLYREGMTVRGCIVAVNNATDETFQQKQDVGSHLADGAGQARERRGGALRFLVDIRPKRLSYSQRHQRVKGGAKQVAALGLHMLRGLFEQRCLATTLKYLNFFGDIVCAKTPFMPGERLTERSVGDSARLDGSSVKDRDSIAIQEKQSTTLVDDAGSAAACLRPGQLVWGRILPQNMPHCVLLELQPFGVSQVEDANKDSSIRRFCSFGSVTGVVLEHQLPEGETVASLQANAQSSGRQERLSCVVLDFDSVTGIADVSCRTCLVRPLQVAHTAVEAAARHSDNKFLHYILVGPSASALSRPAPPDQTEKCKKSLAPIMKKPSDGLCSKQGAVELNSVRKQRAEVVTHVLKQLIRPAAAAGETPSRRQEFLFTSVGNSSVENDGMSDQATDVELSSGDTADRVVDAFPEKVMKRILFFCEGHPAPCAVVQLENASYSVLSTDFDVLLHFSKHKRLNEEQLDALLSGAAELGRSGETARPLHVMVPRDNTFTTTSEGSRFIKASEKNDDGVANGLYIRLPLILFCISCHNNTLLPVQPAPEALQEAAEDAGWRVALTPLQRAFNLRNGTLSVSALLADCCWPMREHRLEQRRQCQQRIQKKGSGEQTGFGAAEAGRKTRVAAGKKVSASQLDGALERVAAPGRILRARVTYVGTAVALARVKAPKRQLLLRLHAPDALPSLVRPPHPAASEVLGVSVNEEHNKPTNFHEKNCSREGGECPEVKGRLLQSSAEVHQERAVAGEEDLGDNDSGRARRFASVVSDLLSATRHSNCCKINNPLKRLSVGMFVDVKVLRLRETRSSTRPAVEVDVSPAAGLQEAACDERNDLNDITAKLYIGKETRAQDNSARRNRWVADVELIGWLEKRKGYRTSGKTHYAYVRNQAQAPSMGCQFTDAETYLDKAAEMRSGEKLARFVKVWQYSPRWAVVEAVCDRYLNVHCGVRGEVLARLFLQQFTKKPGNGWEERGAHCAEGAHARELFSKRGRICCLDAACERRVLQDLRVRFAPGDMVCIRLLPVVSLEKEVFEEAVQRATRAAKSVGDDEKREGSAVLDKQHFREKTRCIDPGVRYTLIANATGTGKKLPLRESETGNDLRTADELGFDTLPQAFNTVPFSLLETPFDSVTHAIEAWARWRYPAGAVCWGRVHHMLSAPFALAVQVGEVTIRKRVSRFSNIESTPFANRDFGRLDFEKEGNVKPVTCGTKHSIVWPILAAVHLTEVMDAWQSHPVQQLKLSVGQLVKVRIVRILDAQQAQQELKHGETQSRSGMPLEASLRMSIVEGLRRSTAGDVSQDYRQLTFDQLKIGDKVSGLVISTGGSGVFVAICRCLTLRIKLQHLTPVDQKTQTSLATVQGILTGAQARILYPVGTAVRGIRIVELHSDSQRIEGSLKPEARRNSLNSQRATSENFLPKSIPAKNKVGLIDGNVKNRSTVSASSLGFCVGDVCEGHIKKVTSFGVFVRLFPPARQSSTNVRESTVDGLCRLRDIGGATVEERTNALNQLTEGNLVKGRVIRMDKATGRVWISLDSSVFEGEHELEVPSGDVELGETLEERRESGEAAEETVFGLHQDVVLEEDANEEKNRGSTSRARKEDCQVKEFFHTFGEGLRSWSIAISGADGDRDEHFKAFQNSSMETVDAVMEGRDCDDKVERDLIRSRISEETNSIAHDVRKTQKNKDQRRNEEDKIRLREEENSNRSWMENPRTPEDFEKLILVCRNSAAVWISYMAHYLDLDDVPRARQVAERAVVHVNYREEKERLNVWLAYLNMECAYGDSVETVFKRAIQYNDAKVLYYQMTFIYEKAHKLTEARSACENCCARFPESQKMWVRHLTLLYSAFKDFFAARELMLQALLRLPRRKHISFAACCARLEYKFGNKERGQTYFEKLIAEHPKRTDLWSQYLDAHILANTPPQRQHADMQSIRLLFERATSVHLKPRNMKFLFTRWLLFEKRCGTRESQNVVRNRAREYVQAVEARLIHRQSS